MHRGREVLNAPRVADGLFDASEALEEIIRRGSHDRRDRGVHVRFVIGAERARRLCWQVPLLHLLLDLCQPLLRKYPGYQ